MDEVRILEIKQSVFANNDQRAELLRRELKEKRIFLLNLMSSPGSGKTTTLTRTIERLRDEFKIGVMERTSTPMWTRVPLRRRALNPFSCTRAVCAIWTRI